MATTLEELLGVAADLRADVRKGLDDVTYTLAALRSDVRAQADRSAAGRGGAARTPGGDGGEGSGDMSPMGRLERITRNIGRSQVAMLALNTFLERVIGAGSSLVGMVRLANPGAAVRFQFAVENAYSALGRMLAPALERLAVVVQTIANAFESFGGVAKTLVAGLTVGSGLAAVLTAVLAAAAAVKFVLGGAVAAVISLASAFLGVALVSGEAGEAFKGLGEVMRLVGQLFEAVAAVVVPVVATALVPVFQFLGAVLKQAVAVVATFANAVGPGVTAVVTLVAEAFGVVVEIFKVIAPVLQLLAVPLQLVASLFSAIAMVVEAVFVPALELLAGAIGVVAAFVEATVGRLLDLLGLAPEERYDPTRRTAVAARSAQMSDLASYANRVYVSAYQTGVSSLPAQHLAETRKGNELLKEIRDRLKREGGGPVERLTGGAVSTETAAGAAIGGLVGGVPGAIVGGAVGWGVDKVRRAWNWLFD